MTGSELKELYQAACDGKGFEGNAGQFKIWQQTLGWCQQADLAQALIWYFQENTAFPMPAELKTLSERARRERLTKSQNEWYVHYRCPICRATITKIHTSEERPPRTCNSPYGAYAGPGKKREMLQHGDVCGGILVIEEDRKLERVRA